MSNSTWLDRVYEGASFMARTSDPSGRVTGSGNLVTKGYELADFTVVRAASSFEIAIRQAESFKVSVTADDNVFEYIRVEHEGSTLQLGLEPGYQFSFNNITLKAEITLPLLAGLNLSGASQATAAGFESNHDLSVQVSGASFLRAEIVAGNVDLNASGASKVTLRGAGQAARLLASGASHLKLSEFALHSAFVNASGASHCALKVETSLDYEVSGASHIQYWGDPTIGRHVTSGASHATHKN